MKRLLTLLLFTLISFASAISLSLEGSWKGKLNVGETELNLVLNFTRGADGKLTCTLDSPDQGAKGIPTEVVSDDPSDNIRKTRCPVFALNGASDTQVLPKTNLNAILHLLPANKKTLTKEYAGLNHLFQQCLTGLPTEYGKIEETMSPAVLKDKAEWINANF